LRRVALEAGRRAGAVEVRRARVRREGKGGHGRQLLDQMAVEVVDGGGGAPDEGWGWVGAGLELGLGLGRLGLGRLGLGLGLGLGAGVGRWG
jgi:hypothetical protein